MSDDLEKKPAKLQISAEQIIQESYDRKDAPLKQSDYRINDMEELKDYQLRIRTSYEKLLQFKRTDLPQYIRYAKWEWELHNYDRARSIFERAINVDHSNVKLWMSYINLEITGKNINHAKNLLERLVTLLPRVDKFYYEYIQLEEKLGNFGNVKLIFKRWLNWKPKSEIYNNFIRFLIKYKDFENARLIYEDLIKHIPTSENFVNFINFEIKNGSVDSVRTLFNMIIENLIKVDKIDESILLKYLDFEVKQQNFAKLREIYKFGLSKSEKLFDEFTNFEKQYGTKDDIEYSILMKRKLKYERELSSLEEWWSYLDLVEELGELDNLQFEKCVASKPEPITHLYTMIWLRYVYWEELVAKDIEKTRALYKRMTKVFGMDQDEVWLKYLQFETRHGELTQVRKVYGYCLGKFQNPKQILTKYVEFELKLKQFDRVRKIYESYLSRHVEDIDVWMNFIDLEIELGENERAEHIFQIVIEQFNKNFKVFQRYLEFLHETMNYEKTRKIYKKLLAGKNSSPQIYISYLMNELLIPTQEQLDNIKSSDVQEFEISMDQITNLEQIYQEGLKYYKDKNETENRVVVFESYKNFIKNYNPLKYDEVLQKLPKLVKRVGEDGEEKLVFIFEQEDTTGGSSFLENARKWMLSQETS